jgi:hypothetical protein
VNVDESNNEQGQATNKDAVTAGHIFVVSFNAQYMAALPAIINNTNVK